MRKKIFIPVLLAAVLLMIISSSFKNNSGYYVSQYKNNLASLKKELADLYSAAAASTPSQKEKLQAAISNTRKKLKACDFWLRYLEPVAYKKINGPLPVEWETEVFEKYEAPYKREGAGLTLAYNYLQNTQHPDKDSLLRLIDASSSVLDVYFADSIIIQLNHHDHFFLCNRLFLLNLATIYTTGFECPDKNTIVPELNSMLEQTAIIYQAYNRDFPSFRLKDDYVTLYNRMTGFVKTQPSSFEQFDHFTFIKNYVNPLFRINQQYISLYKVQSSSQMDYTLNDEAQSIFDKHLYRSQNTSGIYKNILDESVLAEIDSIGKLLFYDPVLSGDNSRSCASCHKPGDYLTDTGTPTMMKFGRKGFLTRNQPSLINAIHNHLLMADGRELTLASQAKAVITNPEEMGGNEEDVLKKVLSIPLYKKYLTKFASFTPGKKEISFQHITSAVTYFYGKYSSYYSPFDDAVNDNKELPADAIKGFNLFMSKAQCGTCHFAPIFNGIKPPYINNEFEVIGVPAGADTKELSNDDGRYRVHASAETKNAFRTPTVRNAAFTKPYMHNGVFTSLEQVIDFYDAGGGAGRKLNVTNQTLSPDSLHLSKEEKLQLIAFINSLSERIPFETPPQNLPLSANKSLNQRRVGGEY